MKNKLFLQKLDKISSLTQAVCLSFFLAGIAGQEVHAGSGTPAVQSVLQTKTVTGQVVDENGEPIIGASVVVEGTTSGTITDLDGKFALQVPSGKKVVVSFVGYIPQNLVPKQGKDFNVVLKEDSKMLEEVVVVGYGTQKAKDVTGSIGVIAPKEIAELPVSNLGAALAGQIPGLSVSGGDNRPGAGASITIRQSFSYSKDGGSSNPMVIIDDVIQIDPNSGLPTLDTFNALDASEVESISVLRDASAAIYGSRASQGAIIVKTKRGKAGTPKISYSGKFGFNDAVGHPKTLTGSAYGRFANSFNLASNKVNGADKSNKLYSDAELTEMDNLNYDWLDEAWSSASSMNHSLNVSGGSEKATYFAGASYYTQGANLGKQDYDKWNFRAGVDVKLSSDLKFSATIAANQQNIQKTYSKGLGKINGYDGIQPGENGEYLLLSHMPTYQPWEVTLDDGRTYYTSPLTTSYDSQGNAKTQDKMSTWNYFAMENSEGSYSTDDSFGYDANFSMSYAVPFIKGLSIKGSYALKRSANDGEQVFMPYTLAHLNAKNSLTEGNRFFSSHPSTSDYLFDEFTGKTTVAYKDVISKSEQSNFYINYEGQFGKHGITAMAAVEKMKSYQSSKQMIYLNPDPDSYLGTSSSAGTMDVGNSILYKYEQGALSYLGRITYNYADKYLLQFIFRSDASTKFAPENYWGFFPGVSVGWVASEESFFKKYVPSWFDYLKLRFSWGQTGKDNLKAWRWKQLYGIDLNKGYGFGGNGGTQSTGILPQATPNRQAHWDTTDKYNLGLDMRFFNGRLSANMDFYYDVNSDILNSNIGGIVGTPIFAGGAISEVNFGRIDAWGSEISLSWRDRVGKVNYNVGVNFGLNANNVKEWPTMPVSLPSINTVREGYSTIFPVWGYKVWKGTSSGDGILRTAEDINNYWSYLQKQAEASGNAPEYLGKKNANELKPGMLAYQDLGGALSSDGTQKGPDGRIMKNEDYAKLCKNDKTYGFTTKLGAEWKGLSFNMMLATSWGGERQIDVSQIKVSKGDMMWSPDSFWKDMYDDTYNTNGKYPNIGNEARVSGSVDSPSDFWSISTFRCYIRNLSVGYTLPKTWLTPLKIESARLSLTGNNLWDLYNPYPDSYRNMYDKTTVLYPTLRTWSLGVNVTF